MEAPTPATGLNIRSIADPDDNEAPPTKELVKKLFCGCESECVMEKYKANFETYCDIMNTGDGTNVAAVHKRCRGLVYYHMAQTCLYPMEECRRRSLPTCVVQAVQARFPDPTGSHRDSEFTVNFYRKGERLFMEIKTRPYPWPYTLG